MRFTDDISCNHAKDKQVVRITVGGVGSPSTEQFSKGVVKYQTPLFLS